MLGFLGHPRVSLGSVVGAAIAHHQDLWSGTVNSTPSKGVINFVYENDQDGEYFRKAYLEDGFKSRSDFIEHLKGLGYNFGETDAVSFVSFVETNQIYREDV